MRTTRRQFLNQTTMGCVLTSAALSLKADPLGLPIGCQTYPVRDALGKDFEGTLAQLASIGYRNIEMCSPPGYEKSGFGSLVNKKASEIREAIHKAGLRCESCHYQFREMKENLEDRIGYAKELGLKQMVLSTFGLRPEASMADWTAAAEELNSLLATAAQRVGV